MKNGVNLMQKNNKNKYPLFSIIVLTYHQRHLLEDCIESILKQDYPNIELVICDDYSSDFNCNEIEKFISNYIEEKEVTNISNVIVYRQEQNVGTTANAQKGVELSNGIYFKLHAGDDMLYGKDTLTKIYRQFSKPEVKIVACRSVACMHDGQITEHLYPSDEAIINMKKADAYGQFELMASQAWGEYINAPAVFWKRELFNEIGGFDLSYKYTEDWPTWIKITLSGQKITILDTVTTIYRYGGISNQFSSINLTLGKQHYQECINMFQKMIIPVFEKSGQKKKIIRCEQCIRAIKARIEIEGQWGSWSLTKQILWRIKNIKLLQLSWLYRKRKHGIVINRKPQIMIMVICLLLCYFNVEIFPNVPIDNLCTILFLVAFIWLVIQECFNIGIKLMNLVLNILRGVKK